MVDTNINKSSKKKTISRIIIGVIAVLLVLTGAFYIYTLDYYKAQNIAKEVMAKNSHNTVKYDDMLMFNPTVENKDKAAVIFYPGGKVENIAYIPLMEKLSQKGVTAVLLKMPFNLAFFKINAADDVYKKLPNIKKWYIAGHSLGGAMASIYAAKNENKINGLILLGAYPASNTKVRTIAIYGSNDKVVNRKKLNKVKNKIEIAGGNHAGFGNYGKQKGDGKAAITSDSQQNQTVEAIMKFMHIEWLI